MKKLKIYPSLSTPQIKVAVNYWLMGRGTHEISERLHVSEAAVANSLSAWREAQRKSAS